MDFKNRSYLPLPSDQGSGYRSIDHFIEKRPNVWALKTGQEFNVLDTLKQSCLHSPNGVLMAFANQVDVFSVQLEIGRITEISFPNAEFVLIGSDSFRAILGSTPEEQVFPHFQYTDTNKINVTCSAFDRCPRDFKPTYHSFNYLSLKSDDFAEQLLQKALWEFSQNNANMAAVLLYAATEVAVEHLSNKDQGRISTNLEHIKKQIEPQNAHMATTIRRLKKEIEKNIIQKRAEVAHKGKTITQGDLLKSFATALEFFWYYDDLKKELSQR